MSERGQERGGGGGVGTLFSGSNCFQGKCGKGLLQSRDFLQKKSNTVLKPIGETEHNYFMIG